MGSGDWEQELGFDPANSFLGWLNSGNYLRSRNDSKPAVSPKPTPAWATAHKAGYLEHTALMKLSRLEVDCPFQVPQLI